jgi:N-acetylneuraminic acid mutarotase
LALFLVLNAVEYNGNVYITCGYNGNEKKHYDDFFKFDVKANQWTEIKPRGVGPNPRRRMSCCVLKDRVFFFGGTRLITLLTVLNFDADSY